MYTYWSKLQSQPCLTSPQPVNPSMHSSFSAALSFSQQSANNYCYIFSHKSPLHQKLTGPAEHRDYAVPDITKSALVVALPPRAPASQLPLLAEKPPNYDALYAAADIVTVHGAAGGLGNGMQGVSGNNVYAVPNAELLCSIDYSVMELRREDLRFVEVLGEGQFGEVSVHQDHYFSLPLLIIVFFYYYYFSSLL